MSFAPAVSALEQDLLELWPTGEKLGLSGVVMEPNVGGRIPLEQVLRSIHLYAHEVAPRLH